MWHFLACRNFSSTFLKKTDSVHTWFLFRKTKIHKVYRNVGFFIVIFSRFQGFDRNKQLIDVMWHSLAFRNFLSILHFVLTVSFKALIMKMSYTSDFFVGMSSTR